MRSGMITLIYKKGDNKLLDNWRPVAVLNVDYKILSRIFANRLKTVIDKVVSPYQTCGPGRDISDTIMSVRDIIDYMDEEEQERCVLKIDQIKAFDKVSHAYLLKVLSKFGFGPNFLAWIKIFYSEICNTVKCNGFTTPYFMVKQSVRQGCPIAALLYIIAVEPLGILLRSNSCIKGIHLLVTPQEPR